MLKKLCLLLMLLFLCASCSALPAEERSFVLALLIDETETGVTLYARIPTYQTGGGYTTLVADGSTFPEALGALEASTPMRLHFGQTRLIALTPATRLNSLLTHLGQVDSLRLQATLAMTDDDPLALAEALSPATGARLSKAMDVLLETRQRQGIIPPCTVSDALRMGDRQSPVLPGLVLDGEAFDLSGSWLIGQQEIAFLSPEKTQLLSLLRGDAGQMTLRLEEGTMTLREASAKARLSENTVHLTLDLSCTASPLSPEAASEAVARSCMTLLEETYALGCDALGLARQAIRSVPDLGAWHALDWPGRMTQIMWTIDVTTHSVA